MKKTVLIAMTGFSMLFAGCGGTQKASHGEAALTDSVPADFKYEVDAFADLQILRYYVPGFNNLSLQQKELVYYLSMAAIEGRDILYDQNMLFFDRKTNHRNRLQELRAKRRRFLIRFGSFFNIYFQFSKAFS